MSLRSEIERIFFDNTNYANPSQAVNQASSLNALSGDLYTDSKRFIYELLQNADDSSQKNEAVKVWIKIFNDNLVIAHSGNAFSSRDIQGICNVNNGTKKNDIEKTGYKGIGFKAVFGQSDKVIIFSKQEYFRFDSSYSFEWKWNVPMTTWELENDRKFTFPWQIIPIYTDVTEVDKEINLFLHSISANVATIIKLKNVKETSIAAQSLSQNVNMFLFLKNISEIHFEIEEKVSLEINRTQNDKIVLKKHNNLAVEWLTNTIRLAVPNDVKINLMDERNIPEKLLNTDFINLTLAAKVGSEGITKLSEHEKLLYSYLPTDETKYSLPVLVNTSFLTTANRESLHSDSKWNQWLFKSIAIEIFNWISKLVNTEYGLQAYQLIPKNSFGNELGKNFNYGIQDAIKNIPFVMDRYGQLRKLEEIILDYTYLSEKKFIGENTIRDYINNVKDKNKSHNREFAQNSKFFSEFKRLGAIGFEWDDLYSFLTSRSFVDSHTINYNIELIKHFKKLSESDKINAVSEDMLRKLPFIWDHKNYINYPNHVCFPTADDQNWDNPDSELSFLHKKLQEWLLNDVESRHWLEKLGIQEKTDITYISQNILPHIDNYISQNNALQTIRDLFSLYKKGALKQDLIKKLSRIKLLTKKGYLCPAKDCFLSDYYRPRAEIEKMIDEDFFVNESYCESIHEKDEWKRFLKMLGVQEGITSVSYTNKTYVNDLIEDDFKNGYFKTGDKSFKPFQSTFNADEFSNIVTLHLIKYTDSNYEFACGFWYDYIENYSPDDIKAPAIAYWGHNGRPGRISGNDIENYVPWFIHNIQCIPTIQGKCDTSPVVFLNTDELLDIGGKYLPIFDGPELSQDWKAFFSFRTKLELQDYLKLLDKILCDVDEKGNIKVENYIRVQAIYTELLAQCANWSSEDIAKVGVWAATGKLQNTKNKPSVCSSLKYFIDGNEVIFQEQYSFIKLNPENKQHPNLEKILDYFHVQILRQSEFELVHDHKEVCLDLKTQLKCILPYLKIWIQNEDGDNNTKKSLEKLEDRLDDLKVFQADDLKIKYVGLDFIKSVNLHYNENNLYVTKPWNSNSVLLKLSEILCRYFHIIGHDKKLDFLLRANDDEIQKYFEQEDINIPEELLIAKRNIEYNVNKQTINSFADIEMAINQKKIPPEYYHLSSHDYSRLQYIQQRIPEAVLKITEYLNRLPEYDCLHSYKIADSIIGGITKNGNEITVVARPSDGDQVLIYYTSEFDVLEYVDAELWCEDGVNEPKQITLGQLLKKTGINRIPVNNLDIQDLEIDVILKEHKSENLDFNAVPYAPERIAKIISSFANTNGGTLIFGLREISQSKNEIVGLSSDFHTVKIVNNAISLLWPVPKVNCNWVNSGDNSIFVIKTEKADTDVLLENKKYIRKDAISILEEDESSEYRVNLNISKFTRTIAIIIAIENYAPRQENQIPTVKYAIKDAFKFKSMIMESMGVAEDDIFMIKNEEAFKSTLEYEFNGLFRSLTEEDRLIFYYVGHGFHNGITNYLSTYDMHQYNIAETAVSLRKILIDPLRKSKCKNALIFIDACAQSFRYENERSNIANINYEELELLTSEFPYYATFLSCQPGESSYSSDILNNGIWTYHLVEAIRGTIPQVMRSNKYITDILLKEYLSSSVPIYTKKELGKDQHPKAILDSNYENIIVEMRNE